MADAYDHAEPETAAADQSAAAGEDAGASATGAPPPGGRVRQPPRLSVRNGYSLFVGTLKVVLPALAVALILLVVVWPQIAPDEDRFRVGVSDLAPDEADNLSMLNARFQGRDEEDRPFTIVADMASQAKSGADLVELERPKADITLDNGAWLALSANHGRYWREQRELLLDGSVSLFHDQGFEMHTERAKVDLKAGVATSDQPVTAQGPSGHLEAEGFRVSDKGETIVFTGKSRLTVYPEPVEATQ